MSTSFTTRIFSLSETFLRAGNIPSTKFAAIGEGLRPSHHSGSATKVRARCSSIVQMEAQTKSPSFMAAYRSLYAICLLSSAKR
jgi:hypothetical protein